MSTTVETLTLIWQRVLQRSPIGPGDSFFDLLADLLFSEIAHVYGRQLQIATLRQAPTIAALAGLLDRSTPPRSSPFVQLKAGNESPPIFITHGLCGTVRFSELAKHIRTGHPIYGIQGMGIDGMEEPFERVEDMARFYLEALENLCPRQKLEPYAAQLALLDEIPGVDWTLAAVIIAEMGVDMSVFQSVSQLASWAGVCPGNNESAGKRKSSRIQVILQPHKAVALTLVVEALVFHLPC